MRIQRMNTGITTSQLLDYMYGRDFNERMGSYHRILCTLAHLIAFAPLTSVSNSPLYRMRTNTSRPYVSVRIFLSNTPRDTLSNVVIVHCTTYKLMRHMTGQA
ncbi:uncharacterized protein LOC128862507 [Anastrepha ludens]|uniref:uncharacterized protein LOC128862507 n=1 Tax=Anastrepha ludens TaxID=28586 RepID=UPI0023B0C287|nr:uncharacterized protein LOC128862507 [Anastrepha ludens]